jgi:hypothetical protein
MSFSGTGLEVADTLKSRLPLCHKKQTQGDVRANNFETPNNLRMCVTNYILSVGTEKRREKVVVLRELQRAIIYTRELSKQVTEGHVSRAFTVYSVN